MKNIPEKIYLQVDTEDEELYNDFEELQEVTWCQDKINDNDIEYIKNDVVRNIERERNYYLLHLQLYEEQITEEEFEAEIDRHPEKYIVDYKED
jgi:hypothetical protein